MMILKLMFPEKSHVHGTEINKQTMRDREIAFFFQQSFWGCDLEPIAATCMEMRLSSVG